MTESESVEPIHLEVRVSLPAARAFRLFTADIGSWWPTHTHYKRGDVVGVVFDERSGGRIYEKTAAGEVADWGEVLIWEPPRRVVFSWSINPDSIAPTEVEVQFIADGEAMTRVQLEHRGWERLGSLAPLERRAYRKGWRGVLGYYVSAAEAARR